MVIPMIERLQWPLSVYRPDLETNYDVIDLTGNVDFVSARYRIGIDNRGSGNFLVVAKDADALNNPFFVRFNGSNNLIILQEQTALRGSIICGSGCIAALMGYQHSLHLNAELYDGGSLFWGRGSRTYGCRIWTHGGKRVVVSDDCLLSEGIRILTSDHHSLISLDDYKQLNQPQDVTIESHVWISFDVSILKGVRVGNGSVIGPGSMVTRDIPATELWAGVPARMIKQNVSWVDSHPPHKNDIELLRAMLDPVKNQM